MPLFRSVSETLARKTSRRGLFGRGADVAFGALAGVAAGTLARGGGVTAGSMTTCDMPGVPCPCDFCVRNAGASNGVCAKPCTITNIWYASGCWVNNAAVTCCDCECPDTETSYCGCSTDYHNDPANCPEAA